MTASLRRYGGVLGMVAIVAFFALSLPDTFLTARNLLNITQQVSMLAVVAATMTVVMVMGDFDLSVGAMASLAALWRACCLFRAGLCPLRLAPHLRSAWSGGC